MFLNRIVLLSAILAVIAQPASGQDGSEQVNARTPENARQFLNILKDQTLVTIVSANNEKRSMISYRVTSIVHKDSCNVVIDGVPRLYGFYQEGWTREKGEAVDLEQGQPGLFDKVDGRIRAAGLQRAPYNLNWGSVSVKDESSESSIRVRMMTPGGVLDLVLLTSEWGRRAGLAITTLIDSCDKTKATGF